MNQSLTQIQTQISALASELGHRMGWRFLNGSPKTLKQHSGIALITLNPGGSIEDADHGTIAMEEGKHSYIDEAWAGHAAGQSPLQQQFRALFRSLAKEHRGATSGDDLLRNTLCGYFVPARSPSWDSLEHQKEWSELGTAIWTDILRDQTLSRIICIDTTTCKSLVKVLNQRSGNTHKAPHKKYSIAWGNISACIYTWPDGTKLLRLPHLSRFRILMRPKSADAVARIIKDFVAG